MPGSHPGTKATFIPATNRHVVDKQGKVLVVHERCSTAAPQIDATQHISAHLVDIPVTCDPSADILFQADVRDGTESGRRLL